MPGQVRRASRASAREVPPLIDFGGDGVREVLLTPGSQRSVQVSSSVVEPGGGGGDELYALHCDVEVVHVLRGRLRLELADGGVELAAGDAFTMPGTTPHTWRNPSQSEACEVLWTLVPAP